MTKDALMQQADAFKSVLLLALFVITFTACLLPFGLRRALAAAETEQRRRRLTRAFGLLSCFGGGVFLATCLLDLLPDAIQQVLDASQLLRMSHTRIPLAEFCVSLGFFAVLFLEQIVLWVRESATRGAADAAEGDEETLVDSERFEGSLPTLQRVDGDSSSARVLLLVAALSLHALFEGLALGVQPSTAAALQVFGALAIHKSVLGASLGLRLVQSALRPTAIVGCCAVFCVMAPVGGFVALGVLDAVRGSVAKLVGGMLQGVACGTFLYVTAFEILPHELNQPGFRLGKMLMMVGGFSVVTLFIVFYPAS